VTQLLGAKKQTERLLGCARFLDAGSPDHSAKDQGSFVPSNKVQYEMNKSNMKPGIGGLETIGDYMMQYVYICLSFPEFLTSSSAAPRN
jgi:hypothetical protein